MKERGSSSILPQIGITFHRHSLHFFLQDDAPAQPIPLDNLKVWGLAWTVKEDHMTAWEPVLDVLGSVLRLLSCWKMKLLPRELREYGRKVFSRMSSY
ncbi:hypothetical protein AVEN_243366-1 [Araneus ventricosus]|uniref:Uncharacterized protein n=1 Tax=Araneus ventricosus TaxID=182803 RepID=A0A4Y2U7P1_ARAVE|nr:hypothetical protein AVEN_243366-1 [Araneus ventricosus]